MSRIRIALFRLDVTPPVGSPICGGLAPAAAGVSDPLSAIGAILLGDDAPVVLCAVDWCEIDNRAHITWRDELARAVGSTSDRVALHSVHQHCAPLVDLEAHRAITQIAGLSGLMDPEHYRSCVARSAEAARSSPSTRTRRTP